MIPWVWPCSIKCVYCLISFGDRVRRRPRTPLHRNTNQF
jgi:wyosine [tRNA(Phe)-imidazoG37] synthetase (radical SAM superfamily)